MSVQAVLLPVFLHVALVFGLLFLMGGRRYAAVKARQVRAADVSAGERTWPPAAQWAANAFINQFELPVLFYALVVLAILTRKADVLFVAMSWIFVLSRFGHAGAYVTTNRVPVRLSLYAIGAVTLGLMWMVFAVRILSTPIPA